MSDFEHASDGLWLYGEINEARHPLDLKSVWRTREGTMIPYADLEDDHLENIITYLKRHGVSPRRTHPNLWRERGRRKAFIHARSEP